MVAEFMEFETPSEPKMGSANAVQYKYNNMILDLNDDLQDEIGTRREQFDSISKTCSDLETRTERNLKLAVIGMTMGMIGICASVASMIL